MTMTNEITMIAAPRTGAFEGVKAFFAMLGSANAVAAAVESRAKPRAADLVRLGIDPAAFATIGRG